MQLILLALIYIPFTFLILLSVFLICLNIHRALGEALSYVPPVISESNEFSFLSGFPLGLS